MADYELIDSGDRRKLERFGPWLLDRPSPQAHWRRALPRARWKEAQGVYHRSSSGGGHWEWRRQPPERWAIRFGELELLVGPTDFGHMGLFVENLHQWPWLRKRCEARSNPVRVLNLFGYTGAMSVLCSLAGAEVTHVDASKGIVRWASDNARANGCGDSIRWIVEDVRSFLRREAKRKSVYNGVILDPPSYGRGARGEVFKIEEHARELLEAVARILDDPSFVLFTCHTPTFSPRVLANLLGDLGLPEGRSRCGEMFAPCEEARKLPSGAFARWDDGRH